MTHFILAAILTFSSNLGYGSLYPGISAKLENPYWVLEVRPEWSRKELNRVGTYSGWGYNVNAAVYVYQHVIIGAELNSEMTKDYTKTTYSPKIGYKYNDFKIEGLFPDSSQNKTIGVRMTNHIPQLPLYMEWEVDRYLQDNKPNYGGKINFVVRLR